MSRRLTAGRAGALAGMVTTAVFAGRVLERRYEAGIQAAYADLDAADTRVVETTAGQVEYQTTGEGPPVLVAHGIVGGFDQAVLTGRQLLGTDARILGVSRFGYLGSDLPADPRPTTQARAYAALLDELGHDDVVVIGTSAGGAPAIRFALDYPDRTRGLVLLGSAAPSTDANTGPTGPPSALLRDPVFWFLVEYAPQVFHRLFGIDRAAYAEATPHAREQVQDLLDTLLPVEPRVPGVRNDTRVTSGAMVDHFETYDLERLAVPTLVVHAEDDPLASFDDAERMAERIPNADFRRFESGGHLVFGHDAELRDAVSAFVDGL